MVLVTLFATRSLLSRAKSRGGYLVYLSDGDVPFLRVSFSPISSTAGYQKEEIFLEPVVKRCQKGKFC